MFFGPRLSAAQNLIAGRKALLESWSRQTSCGATLKMHQRETVPLPESRLRHDRTLQGGMKHHPVVFIARVLNPER